VEIAVFEDTAVENFGPLTLTRPAYKLLCGTTTLLEKINQHLAMGTSPYLYTRDHLAPVLREQHPHNPVNEQPTENLLLVNGLLVVDIDTASRIKGLDQNTALVKDGRVAAARLKKERVEKIANLLKGGEIPYSLFDRVEEAAHLKLLRYPWEIVYLGPALIGSEARGKLYRSENVRGNVFVKDGVEVEGNVVLDGRDGPVVLDNNVHVEAFTKLVGPCYVGEGTIVVSGSVVSRSCIGPVCRVGGEVENTVILGYSNKRHYGFLGHSLVGEWVNMGAGTTVSNLKNTYGTVRVRVGGGRTDTGLQFLGSFFGDHVKSSIGCMVSGGLNIGVSSHLYGDVSEDVPSFTIYRPGEKKELLLSSALETAKRMMSRRGITPSEQYLRMLEEVFRITRPSRASLL
jgi:UDP-N-acetylglucosamine diphosphorylase/glucosamine-1-phosphate N-acetyltransferase